MNFLKEVDFTVDEIVALEENLNDAVSVKISEFPNLVLKNIKFLKKLGINNYKEVFVKFREKFLEDPSKFKETFNKYDRRDLVEKIENNSDIVEYL